MKNAIHIVHKFPNLFHTGKGVEIQNNEFNSILKKYILKIYHIKNEEKSSIILKYIIEHKMKILKTIWD